MSSKRETKDAISNHLKGLQRCDRDTGSEYPMDQVFTRLHAELKKRNSDFAETLVRVDSVFGFADCM